MPQFLRFGLALGAAFLVDAGVTLGLVWLGMAPWSARLGGYLAAVNASYLLNRRFTFQSTQAITLAQWWAYFLSQKPAALANLGLSLLLIQMGLAGSFLLLLAVAAGSLGGMIINYVLARRVMQQP